MVPELDESLKPTDRFPRPRGDGPSTPTASHLWSPVSPPARGWSVHMTSADHCAEGFPARAGMVLLGVPRIRRSARFPRPRGDGPEWIPGKPMTGEVSPPARGWSL